MTIQELIKRYGCANDEIDITLIKMYAGCVLCDECPLRKQCTIKMMYNVTDICRYVIDYYYKNEYGITQECVDYLANILEVE